VRGGLRGVGRTVILLVLGVEIVYLLMLGVYLSQILKELRSLSLCIEFLPPGLPRY